MTGTDRGLRARTSGVLLHPTSLPGAHGIGDLGRGARAFVDFLARGRQCWWQTLPLTPAGAGNSPYSGASAFAGNPLLVDLEALVDAGLLDRSQMPAPMHTERVDYGAAATVRTDALRLAFARFGRSGSEQQMAAFRERTAWWLPDFALFSALSGAHGGRPWTTWSAELRTRAPQALARARRELASEIAFVEFQQLVFDRQWHALRRHAAARGVGIFGDVPIFVAHDSADVWSHPRLFLLREDGEPTHVSGVPPDCFSADGQRWGTPLYRWSHSRRTGHRWWIERLRCALQRTDLVRLDHFVGFAHYWAVQSHEPTAKHGRWAMGPGAELFDAARTALDWESWPLVAEDLGTVTAQVHALRERLGLPGMQVLQFVLGEASPAALETVPADCVLYTGTHDNDTVVGWLDKGGDALRRAARQATRRGEIGEAEPLHRALVELSMASRARTVIVPMQDLLGLGSEARMNTPGEPDGHWTWRVPQGVEYGALAEDLAARTVRYGRDRRSASSAASSAT